jgi:RNase H-fold protein (predicted Holliday junction resolvase)
MKSLDYIIEHDEIKIETVNEDYTSVQSGEIISNFKKNSAEDTISAMLILERRKNNK